MSHVLVVDDELGVRHSLATTLKAEGFTVRLARNGKEAIRKQRRQPSPVICLDMRMPEMDGIETYRTIREFDGSAAFVAVTAFESTYRPRVENVEFVDWVPKPIMSAERSERFIDAVRRGYGMGMAGLIPEVVGMVEAEFDPAELDVLAKAGEIISRRVKTWEGVGEEGVGWSSVRELKILVMISALLRESPVAWDLLSRSLFSEIPYPKTFVKALRSRGIVKISGAYQTDMKKLGDLIAAAWPDEDL